MPCVSIHLLFPSISWTFGKFSLPLFYTSNAYSFRMRLFNWQLRIGVFNICWIARVSLNFAGVFLWFRRHCPHLTEKESEESIITKPSLFWHSILCLEDEEKIAKAVVYPVLKFVLKIMEIWIRFWWNLHKFL